MFSFCSATLGASSYGRGIGTVPFGQISGTKGQVASSMREVLRIMLKVGTAQDICS